ncbi:MAG: type II toxin-antitoxin system HicA family toxin [Planctomycetota bacterium]|nr:type II toxin-antitoxin system HicA family toxin [Planctomycetota bacterium]
MAKLPRDLSGHDVRAALEKIGFAFRRQRGSHMVLRRDDPPARVVVPDHRTIRVGTLRQFIAGANLTIDEFLRLLN